MINIKSDSRLIKPGDIFVAIKGFSVDGHDYIKEAIKKGAAKIIAEHGTYEVETEIVPDTKEYLTNYLVANYKELLSNLKFVGITGTNGKTTTAFIVYQLLEELGEKCAYIGTIGFFLNGGFIRELPNTTLDIASTYLLIEEAKNKGITTIVMEVSSHSLEEKRLDGISFDVGAFTNLTQDHLDYHLTMDNYLKSKTKILKKIKETGRMVVNADDEYYKNFLSAKSITIGKKGKDYKFNNYKLEPGVSGISFTNKGKDYKFKTNFTGEFNVYNFVMALAIVSELGYSIKQILEIVSKIKPPKGRCQTLGHKDCQIVIDYAHTPDAVEKIVNCFKMVKKNKMLIIIGCGGDRDTKKRPIMGSFATLNSDYVIFTNDNPRSEDEKKIMADILEGVTSNNYEVIYDRKDAIEKGMSLLNPGDILLILGKGHENYQIIGKEKIPFDDARVVQEIISKAKNS